MNFLGMRTEFDRINRSLDDSSFEEYRDKWLNEAWVKISEMFTIPSLKRTATLDAVEDQSKYLLPYDYGGTEVSIDYTGSSTKSRLDPIPQEVLALQYERRSGNMGRVEYYDWCEPCGTTLRFPTDCVITDDSVTVLCASAVAADEDEWVRFDPFTDAAGDTQNPGDYGYRIVTSTVGVSWTLDRAYRGPSSLVGTPASAEVRPAEQQQFIVYGNPSDDKTDAFSLTYYARPRVLYSDTDVPEYPTLAICIVYMAISMGYDFISHFDIGKVWFGRAMSRTEALRRRRNHAQALVTDLTVGSVSGRQVGSRGIFTKGGGSRRY